MPDDPTPNLERFVSYEHARREFRSLVPESFNIADAILSRHPDSVTRVALVEAKLGGLNTYTYGGLDYLSDKFANALDKRGVRFGDSVAVILPQSAAAIIAQLGVLKLGAVVIPLSLDLDAAALEFSLRDSAPRAAVVHHTLRDRLRMTGVAIEGVFAVNILTAEFQDVSPGFDFWRAVFEASAEFTTVETTAYAPAFIFYVATSEGLIRATQSHASLIYQLPAFEMGDGFQLGEPSTLWTPQDWASVDSTVCSVYPALWYGWRVAACEARPAIAGASSLIDRCEITDLFATVVEVEALRESNQRSIPESGFKLRNIVCASPVPADLHDWASQSFGASINAVYTNTLLGSVAASCKRWYETPRGSLGRAVPGYSIETVDQRGGFLPARSEGRLAIRREELGASVEQARSQPSSATNPSEGWVVTDDVGFKDEDGNFWPSRSD
ncbi:MAG: AMP-binding protein [Acidobacteriota bacterium]